MAGKHAKMGTVKKIKVLRKLTKQGAVSKKQAAGMFFDKQKTGKRK